MSFSFREYHWKIGLILFSLLFIKNFGITEEPNLNSSLKEVKVKIFTPSKVENKKDPVQKVEERPIIRTPKGSVEKHEISPQSPLSQQPLQQDLLQSGRNRSSDKFHQYLEQLNQQRITREGFDRKPRFGERLSPQQMSHIREQIHIQHPNYRNWFSDPFFQRYNLRPDYISKNVNVWGSTRWRQINRWMGLSWNAPVYFNDNGQLIELSPDTEGSYVTSDVMTSQWQPLGVFVMTQSLEQMASSNLFIQIALNKKGEVAGTLYNASKDLISQIDGVLDVKTQQAAFKQTDDPDSPFMVTGLYDLTQDVAPVQMIFPNGTRQIWLLVRIT